jgi:hypothetical protein
VLPIVLTVLRRLDGTIEWGNSEHQPGRRDTTASRHKRDLLLAATTLCRWPLRRYDAGRYDAKTLAATTL